MSEKTFNAAEYRRRWVAANPDKVREYNKRAKKKEWLSLSPEERDARKAKAAAWMSANPEKAKVIQCRAKKKFLAKPEKRKAALAANREWHRNNREKVQESNRVWRKANPEKVKEANLRSRERRKAKDPEVFRRQSKKWRTRNRAQYILLSVRAECRKTGTTCDLTREWIDERFKAGVCEMSGIPFDMEGSRTPHSPSIDRRNPGGPYTAANCRMIVWALNHALSDRGEDYMVDLFQRVIARRHKPVAGLLSLVA